MQSRSRLALVVAVAALAVAACGSSSASPAASSASTASSAPGGSASPVASAVAADSPAPSVAAVSPAPPGSAVPRRSPTPAEQALIGQLPTKIGPLPMTGIAGTLSDLIASDPGSKGLADFITSLGISASDSIYALAVPTSRPNFALSVGAYRFTGADPAALKQKFIKWNIDAQPGATVVDKQVGGRTVSALIAPPQPAASASASSNPNQWPVYLVFVGDTVFVASSSDEATAADIVASFPK
jgi:hypothetical protein